MKKLWNTIREWKWLTILAMALIVVSVVNVLVTGNILEGIFGVIIAFVLVEVDKD